MRARNYEKSAPRRSTPRLFIICEGEKREPDYFTSYVKGAKGRVSIEVVSPKSENQDHSPLGLFKYAKTKFNAGSIEKGDSVWFVFDTDDWANIPEARVKIENYAEWHAIQSNPCFEVWLMFHHVDTIPGNAPLSSSEWKAYLHNKQSSDSVDYSNEDVRHSAKTRAENAYQAEPDGSPSLYSTEMHLLMDELLKTTN